MAYSIMDEVEEGDIIGDILMENDIEVDEDDPVYLRDFTVKGEALFECDECDSRWSSYNATIKVDLLAQHVSRKYTQKCKTCEYWATPQFTRDRFQHIINRVMNKYEDRVARNGQRPASHGQEGFSGCTQAPHMEEYCERCQELGEPCSNQLDHVPSTLQQDDYS